MVGKKETTKSTVKKVAKAVVTKPIAHGVGRRKSSVARAWLRRGTGEIRVNKKSFVEYFDTDIMRLAASKPFAVIDQKSASLDVDIDVKGGGKNSQADAVKLGIARALVNYDEQLRGLLRSHDLLTVDARVKERKKYGQRGARRKFQFVKR